MFVLLNLFSSILKYHVSHRIIMLPFWQIELELILLFFILLSAERCISYDTMKNFKSRKALYILSEQK